MTFYCSVSETIFRREKRQLSLILDCVMRNANAHIVRYIRNGFSLLLVMGQASRIFLLLFFSSVGWFSFQVLTSVHTHICHHRHFTSFVGGRWAGLIQCHYFLWRLRSFRWFFFLSFSLAYARVALFGSLCTYIIIKYTKAQRVWYATKWRQTIARVTYNTLIFMLEIAPGGIEN